MNTTLRMFLTTLKAFLLFTLLLGLLYPAAIWTLGRIWSEKADGSLITNSAGEIQGSALIAQEVTTPGFFYPRPSAAGKDGYDAMNSAASNLSPRSKEFQAEVDKRRTVVAEREGIDPNQVPVEALTASGSGLDPHISESYAHLQLPRVARETHLLEDQIEGFILECSENAFTEPASRSGSRLVNVVKLNAKVAEAVRANTSPHS